MEIGRKIYYEKATGNVILDTGERTGDVIETTLEQDFASYVVLQSRVQDTVGVIQLAYNQDLDKFSKYPYHIDITTQQVVWDTNNNGTLEDAVSQKLSQLAYLRDGEIYSTFQSSALGTVKTYNYNKEAYENFRGKAIMLNLDPSISTVMWATIEDGFVSHTREQFITVITDGANHEETLKMKYYNLEAQVKACATIDDVDAITW